MSAMVHMKNGCVAYNCATLRGSVSVVSLARGRVCVRAGRFVVFERSVGAETSFLGHRTVGVTSTVATVGPEGSNHRQLHQSKNDANKVGKPDGCAVDAVVAVQSP